MGEVEEEQEAAEGGGGGGGGGGFGGGGGGGSGKLLNGIRHSSVECHQTPVSLLYYSVYCFVVSMN